MAEDSLIQSGPEDSRTLPQQPIGEYLLDRLQQHGDTVAQIDAMTGAQKTCSQLRDEALAISGGLQELGVMPGDVVMVACGNHHDFSAIMLGALHAGASLAPVNPQLDRGDLSHLLSVLEPKVVFCEPSCDTLPPLLDGPTLVVLDSPDFDALLHKTPGVFKCSDNPVALIMCSSGTTGSPKGVMLSHRNLHAQLLQFRDLDQPMLAGLSALVLSPAFWVTGTLMQILSLDAGGTAVLLKEFSPELLVDTIEKYKVFVALIGPSQLVLLALSDATDGRDLSSLKMVSFGGAAVSQALHERAELRLGLPVTSAYGMTEVLGVMRAAPPGTPQDRASCGRLAINTRAKVIDLETGHVLGPGEEGELCLRGPTIMLGYYRNPEATAETIDAEGWLHTGDVAYYNEDGYFYILDRIKSLIKYRGVSVPPAEMEGALLSHPAVQEAAVVGVHHDTDQERAVGCVVLRPGESASPEELAQHVAGLLSPLKHLHGGVRILESIPKTASGKVRRRELRQLIEA